MLTFLAVDGYQLHPKQGSASTWLSVESVTGLGSPPPRAEVYELARQHGQLDRTQFYNGRTLDISGRVLSSHTASDAHVVAALDEIKGRFRLTGKSTRLTFRRAGMDDDEFVDARVSAPFEVEFVPRRHGVLGWGVQVFAADPRMYTAGLKFQSGDPTTMGFGLDLPVDFPMIFSGTPQGNLVCVNGGNFSTPPTITLTGPAVDPIVENLTVGRRVSIVGQLAAADKLVINAATREVTVNGAPRADLISVTTTQWWELQPGTNQVHLSASGLLAGTSLLRVEWRDARI